MADLIIWNLGIPNSNIRPSGPHQLAAWLSKFGYDVKVIDFSTLIPAQSLIDISEKYITKNTIAIGVSLSFVDTGVLHSLLNTRQCIESKHPHLEWILGGQNVYDKDGKVGVNWRIFSGYSEDVVLRYLNEKTKKIKFTAFDIENLEHHYLDNLGIKPQEVLGIQLARGCQFKCKFCGYSLIGKQKGTYIRNMSLVEKELKFLHERYGVSRFVFVDDTVNESKEKILQLAEIAARLPFRLEWVGYNRLDLIHAWPEQIELLEASGLRGAFFGIESFNLIAASTIGKRWNAVKGKDFLLELKEYWKDRITWTLAFIIGLPGDTDQSIEENFNWCVRNGMRSWYWAALGINSDRNNPYKSEFEKNYDKYGYTFPTDDPFNWVNKNSGWDHVTALKKELLMIERSSVYEKYAAFQLARAASVLDRPFDDLIHLPAKSKDKELKLQLQKFVTDYVDFQLRS